MWVGGGRLIEVSLITPRGFVLRQQSRNKRDKSNSYTFVSCCCCCHLGVVVATQTNKRERLGVCFLVLNKSVPQGFSNQLEKVEKWRHDCCVTLQSFGPPTGLTLAVVVVVISVPF